ncbi:MAG: FRG domain-containing protein [Clostridiales bacterium]|nr:FRG domain-containing protein [Clostridiales bacterium]
MILNDYTSVDIENLSQFISVINDYVSPRGHKKEFTRINNLYWYIDDLHRTLNHLRFEFDEVIDNDIELYRCAREILDTETELEYWQQFRKHAKKLENDDILFSKSNFRQYKYYFRGHYNAQLYRLLPGVLRDSEPLKEDFYYHNIKVQCSEDFINCNHIHQLVQMQHYDCPTRLLDITSNPLVALYFACKNFRCERCDKANIGEVFIFAVKESEILYYDSDKALMLSCLPRFSYADKMEIYDACYKKIRTHGKFDAPNNGTTVERLYHEIKTEVPSFEKKINPVDLLTPFFVQPLKMNARILKQDGAFIINGLSKSTDDAIQKLEYLVTTRIRVHNQDNILKELDKLGINEATLFPEVDKVANYLKSK